MNAFKTCCWFIGFGIWSIFFDLFVKFYSISCTRHFAKEQCISDDIRNVRFVSLATYRSIKGS